MGLFGMFANSVVEAVSRGRYSLDNVTDTSWDGSISSANDYAQTVEDIGEALGGITGWAIAGDKGEKMGQKIGRHAARKRV